MQGKTIADRAGATLWGGWVVWLPGQAPSVPSGSLWAFREGYFTPTDDERILKRLDGGGEVIGFLIHEMSTLKRPSPIEFELSSELPADDVVNLTASQAAARLGISDRRVRKLARDGRVRGATKTGQE